MKKKSWVLVTMVLIFVIGLSGIDNIEAQRIVEDGYKDKTPKEAALHFMKNFENNTFDGEPMNFDMKKMKLTNLIFMFGKISKIEFVARFGRVLTWNGTLKQIPWDMVLAFIIHEKNLKVELIREDAAILITAL